jgi:hypothetical protein
MFFYLDKEPETNFTLEGEAYGVELPHKTYEIGRGDTKKIFSNGVVIGYFYPPEGRMDERVRAVGGDKEIQHLLEVWLARRRIENENRQRDRDIVWRYENEMRMKEEVSNARKAIGLE